MKRFVEVVMFTAEIALIFFYGSTQIAIPLLLLGVLLGGEVYKLFFLPLVWIASLVFYLVMRGIFIKGYERKYGRGEYMQKKMLIERNIKVANSGKTFKIISTIVPVLCSVISLVAILIILPNIINSFGVGSDAVNQIYLVASMLLMAILLLSGVFPIINIVLEIKKNIKLLRTYDEENGIVERTEEE